MKHNKFNYNKIRALADSKSLRLRFSDEKTFRAYEPNGNISKKLYKIAEKISPNSLLFNADFLNLKFKPNSFEAIMSKASIHNFPKEDAIIVIVILCGSLLANNLIIHNQRQPSTLSRD